MQVDFDSAYYKAEQDRIDYKEGIDRQCADIEDEILSLARATSSADYENLGNLYKQVRLCWPIDATKALTTAISVKPILFGRSLTTSPLELIRTHQ